MVEERSNLDSSQQKGEASTIKVQNEQNLKRNTPSCSTSKLNLVKESSLGKETGKKLDFGEVVSFLLHYFYSLSAPFDLWTVVSYFS